MAFSELENIETMIAICPYNGMTIGPCTLKIHALTNRGEGFQLLPVQIWATHARVPVKHVVNNNHTICLVLY